MELRTLHKIYVAEDTAEAEHVLVFKIAAVAPSVDLYGYLILARLHKSADIELGVFCRALAVTDLLAVHPDIEGAVDAVEMDEDRGLCPGFGQSEGALV